MKKLVISMITLFFLLPSSIFATSRWNFQTYVKDMKQSHRKVDINARTFQKIQDRKKKALESIKHYLTRKFGYANKNVLKAFQEVPREYFMYNYEENKNRAYLSYNIPAHPWDIGYGSLISDYLGQAYMTQLVHPKPTDVALEIGTGSGYQIAVLSRLVKKAYSIEIITPLGNKVKRIFPPLGYDNIYTKVGDGFYGWPQVRGGFDIIMVTCVAPFVPPPLLKQLKRNGRMIIPIGQPYKRGQFFYIFTKDKNGKIHSRKDMKCYFIPMTGHIQKVNRD